MFVSFFIFLGIRLYALDAKVDNDGFFNKHEIKGIVIFGLSFNSWTILECCSRF